MNWGVSSHYVRCKGWGTCGNVFRKNFWKLFKQIPIGVSFDGQVESQKAATKLENYNAVNTSSEKKKKPFP